MAPAKSPLVRLRHIKHEITALVSSVDGLGDDAILASHVHRRALERSVEIISEAATSLPDRLRETEPTMPWKEAAKELPEDIRQREPEVPWRQIISLGNYLRHEYYRINPSDVRSILQTHLPTLRLAVLRLLDGLNSKPKD